MATSTRSSAQLKLHKTDSFVERMYPRHRKRLKAGKTIKMVLTDPSLNSEQPNIVTKRGLPCIETVKHNQVKRSKSPDLKSNQRRNQPTDVSPSCDVLSPTGNRKEDDPLIGQLTSAELNHCETEEQCQMASCDTFPADTFPMTNRTLLESMSISISRSSSSSSTLHASSSNWPTSASGSASSYSPDLLIAKSWRLRFLSNQRLSAISVIKCLLLLLPIWLTFVPSDTIEQRHSFSIFAHAAKSKSRHHYFLPFSSSSSLAYVCSFTLCFLLFTCVLCVFIAPISSAKIDDTERKRSDR